MLDHCLELGLYNQSSVHKRPHNHQEYIQMGFSLFGLSLWSKAYLQGLRFIK
jgi:hypothetical protein